MSWGQSTQANLSRVEIGNGFFIPGVDSEKSKLLQALLSDLAPKRFRTRELDGCVSVWRVE